MSHTDAAIIHHATKVIALKTTTYRQVVDLTTQSNHLGGRSGAN